jgi:hypothetical protein
MCTSPLGNKSLLAVFVVQKVTQIKKKRLHKEQIFCGFSHVFVVNLFVCHLLNASEHCGSLKKKEKKRKIRNLFQFDDNKKSESRKENKRKNYLRNCRRVLVTVVERILLRDAEDIEYEELQDKIINQNPTHRIAHPDHNNNIIRTQKNSFLSFFSSYHSYMPFNVSRS